MMVNSIIKRTEIFILASSFVVSAGIALTFTAGQKIAPRSIIENQDFQQRIVVKELPLRKSLHDSIIESGRSNNDDVSEINRHPHHLKSFFDLPSVEAWGAKHGIKEHHLKFLYRVIFHDNSLFLPLNGLYNPSPVLSTTSNGTDVNLDALSKRLMEAGFPRRCTMQFLSEFSFTCRIVRVEESDSGGRKFVIQIPSGKLIETVLVRHERNIGAVRYTVCVSSQVGCAKKCSFCATGTMGLKAQLSSGEILEQVFLVQEYLKHFQTCNKAKIDPQTLLSKGRIRNVVFMGMGEPFDNYDSVHESLRGLTHQCLFGLAAKQITVSTVGASLSKIKLLADEASQVSLALSLHSAIQESRSRLIPSAQSSSIEDLGKALDYHAMKSGRGAMLEYLLIDNVNDGNDEVEALIKFCIERQIKYKEEYGIKKHPVFVNLIPYNPTLAGDEFGYSTPSNERINAFHERLKENGVKSIVRWSSAGGRDAISGCGQLALSSHKGK